MELVDAHGRLANIGGPKRRTVLAVLALNANEAVSTDRLLDWVWDGSPPAHGRAALHGHIAALRKVLPSELRLETEVTGYRLVGRADLVDVHRFEAMRLRAAAVHQLEDRSYILRQSLDLWRGSPLADLPPSEFQRSAGEGLHSRRIAAVMAWAECELLLGTGERAVPALEVAVRAEGLHEQLAIMLIRCLRQAGRQTDALAAYQRTCARLREETNAEPSDLLRSALGGALVDEHRRHASWHDRELPAGLEVQSHRRRTGPAPADPASGAPAAPPSNSPPAAPVPDLLPRPVRDFVGRTAEHRWLQGVARAAGRNQPVLAVIVGPAGVGKTAFVVQWANQNRHHFPDGRLFVDLRGFDTRDEVKCATVLAGFLRALGIHDADIPAQAQARRELFERVTHDRCLLVVLDNAAATTDLQPLLPSGPGCTTVVTSRATRLDLTGQASAVGRTLGPLPSDQAVALLRSLLGSERVDGQPEAARRLAELCDWLPLALRVCASRLAVRPNWSMADLVHEIEDERTRLASMDTPGGLGVRAALAATRRVLPGSSARLLGLLGLYPGEEVDSARAAILLGSEQQQARRALGALAAYHLLSETRPGRYNRSPLVQLYGLHLLNTEIAAEETDGALTRLLDHYLHATADAASAVTSYTWLLQRPHDTTVADKTSRMSAFQALTWFWQEEPALRSLVLDASKRRPNDQVWKLVENLHPLYHHSDLPQHWIEVARAGLRSAGMQRNDAGAVMRMRSNLGAALTEAGRPWDALSHLEAVASSAEDDPRAQLVAKVRLGRCYQRAGRAHADIRECFDSAAARAREIGDAGLRALVEHHLSTSAYAAGDPATARHHAHTALGLLMSRPPADSMWPLLEHGRSLHAMSCHVEARPYVANAVRLMAEQGESAAREEAETLLRKIDEAMAGPLPELGR